MLEIFGIVLIINSLLIIFSKKYFLFLNRIFFIENASDAQKRRVEEFVDNNKNSDRPVVFVASLGLGIISLAWSLGVIESITFPFFVLALSLFIAKKFKIK